MKTASTTKAGQKIEAYRDQRDARLTREALADRIGFVTASAVQQWERFGKVPNARTMNRIADMGIAAHADWFEAAVIYERPLLCTLCDLRTDDPVVRSCSEANCPNVGQEHSQMERAA